MTFRPTNVLFTSTTNNTQRPVTHCNGKFIPNLMQMRDRRHFTKIKYLRWLNWQKWSVWKCRWRTRFTFRSCSARSDCCGRSKVQMVGYPTLTCSLKATNRTPVSYWSQRTPSLASCCRLPPLRGSFFTSNRKLKVCSLSTASDLRSGLAKGNLPVPDPE